MAIVKNDSVIDQEWITLDAEADLPPGEENIMRSICLSSLYVKKTISPGCHGADLPCLLCADKKSTRYLNRA